MTSWVGVRVPSEYVECTCKSTVFISASFLIKLIWFKNIQLEFKCQMIMGTRQKLVIVKFILKVYNMMECKNRPFLHARVQDLYIRANLICAENMRKNGENHEKKITCFVIIIFTKQCG